MQIYLQTFVHTTFVFLFPYNFCYKLEITAVTGAEIQQVGGISANYK